VQEGPVRRGSWNRWHARAGALSVLQVNFTPEWFKRLWRKHRGVVVGVLAIAAVALVIALIWPVTDLIAAHDVGLVAGLPRAAALQAAREAVRTQLLTLGAGVFAAGALIFTSRNFILSRRTLELTEQGQVTDRYTKAIEQLGSDNASMRLGAIYALERIARDSARDRASVIAVLAAYVREQSHDANSWRDVVMAPGSDLTSDVRLPGPDLSAALLVLGRRDRQLDVGRIDLANVDLSRAYLHSALLDNADLQGALLMGTDLTEADLSGTQLLGAQLTNADLSRADLSGAEIVWANFARANLTDADLSAASWGRSLFVPDLTDAVLSGAIVDPGVPLPPAWHRDRGSGRAERGAPDEQEDG
jgi:uncharacterized protein YjbI with pentapeptide repeats